ncbi:MAG: hypothetical protein ORN54_08960 [Cyclobacteriaceae bacterium]|nr:hypothetical protein [Cyclobacteriaceae bacterium]
MEKLRFDRLFYVFSLISFISACATPQVGQPPPSAIFIRTFYKSTAGADLLDQSRTGTFKKSELKIVSRVEVNGISKEVIYGDSGVTVEWDNESRMHYLGINVPTNFKKNPIETYVHLSPTIVDTVTYSFLGKQRPYIPDKIYYNKKLVWDVVNVPDDGLWPSIIIIK